MEVLLILGGAGLLLAIPVCVVVLLVGQSSLKARVAKLERALKELPRAAAEPVLATATLAEPAITPIIVPATSPEPQALPQAPELAAAVVAPDAPDSPPSRAIVLRADRFSALAAWLTRNWVYAISALSLALAGVFFVQYGVERGLLPPGLRVLVAIGFGGCLIGAGDWLRRRHGDDAAATTAYLPSVFSGAGLVSIFAAIIAARQMYGLIGSELAFAGLLATALLAVGLGWFYGPLLVSVGLLGAAAAPFLVEGGGTPAAWLYGYFALVAGIGLTVDAVRRWAWVSVLALALAYGAGWLVLMAGAGTAGAVGLLAGLALMAVALPILRPVPDHPGPSVLQSARHKGKHGWPIFPVRLAGGAGLASAIALTLIYGNTPDESLLIFAALTLLALACLLWAEPAAGLADLALLPVAAFIARLLSEGLLGSPLSDDFANQAILLREPESAAPMTVSLLLAMAVLISGASAWRALRGGVFPLAFGLGAVLTAPVAAAVLELCWNPSPVIGAYPWALQVMALAGAMVALALRFAKADGADRRRAAHAVLSALSLIALALFLLTTKSALTLALAVLVVAAAGLDRRFRLPEMGWFIQLGVAVLGYRLLADPGIGWALEEPVMVVSVTFLGVIAGLLAALWLLHPLDRQLPKGVLELAAAGFAAIFANIVITRQLLSGTGGPGSLDSHYGAALNALPWLVLMLMQLYRARLGGPLRRFRLGVAAVAGLIATAGMLVAVWPLNPLFSYGPEQDNALVRGPMILDTLALAYAIPGLMLLVAVWHRFALPRPLRLGFLAAGAALIALYVGLEIRRFWQGDWLGGTEVGQGELYTYTVALMLLGAAILYQAIARRSTTLRRIAMAVIAVTVAKVFLIDASGLTGLTRVASFLGLGLSLAGLAWLNRWAGQVSEK